MCGRYQFSLDDEDVIDEINKILTRLNEKYNQPQIHLGEIYPTDSAPVIMNENDVALSSWGFPKWDNKGVIINARSETVKEKSLFAAPFKTARCVVPAAGFYEWQKKAAGPKDKYLFRYRDRPLIYMAGIYKSFGTPENPCMHFVILTQKANKYMADIHDRMPVMLYENEIDDWINDRSFVEAAINRTDVALTKERMKNNKPAVKQLSLLDLE